MNESNFQYLKDNIKYMGFGENMTEELQANLQQGKSDFTLSRTMDLKKPFEVNLHFRKSDSSDMYFFNSYTATLDRSNGEKVGQTFYLTNGKGITAKEAYNMLEGRAVHKELTNKEGASYKAWLQLDFGKKDNNQNYEVKQFHENYGFDLNSALSKLSISELNDPEKTKTLIQSLQKGNIQAVSVENDWVKAKMFVEANPQYKTVNLYDSQFRRINKQELGQYQSGGQSSDQKLQTEQKQDMPDSKKKAVKQDGNQLAAEKKKGTGKKRIPT